MEWSWLGWLCSFFQTSLEVVGLMADSRDIPFKTYAKGPSAQGEEGPTPGATQAFRRQGQRGKSFAYTQGEIQAMSNRFQLLGRDVAEGAIDIMRRNVIKYIKPGAGVFHGYSTGRLAATIGMWDPDIVVKSESGAADIEMAIKWAAANGVAGEKKDSYEDTTIIQNGAYSSVKRYKGDVWTAEMGTFTPYAGLVEDGGSMPIANYGNPSQTRTAHWEAQHMFKRGMFDSYAELEKEISGKVKDIM